MAYDPVTSTCYPPSCRLHEHTQAEVDAFLARYQQASRVKGTKKPEAREVKKLHLEWRLNTSCTKIDCNCCGYFWGLAREDDAPSKVGQKVRWS